MRGGKHSELAKPAFPPRAPPFRACSCCALWGCVYVCRWRGDGFCGVGCGRLCRFFYSATGWTVALYFQGTYLIWLKRSFESVYERFGTPFFINIYQKMLGQLFITHLATKYNTHSKVESEAPRLDISRQATGKLSLSSRSSNAALMTHPTLGKPLHIPPRTKFSLQPLIPDHLITLPVIHSHHPT